MSGKVNQPMEKPIFQPGQHLRAEDMNRLTDALLERLVGGGGNLVRSVGSRLAMVGVEKPGGTAATPTALFVRRMVVVSEGDDILVCGSVESDQLSFIVAKPFMLQKTPFDGATWDGITYDYSSKNEREADDGSGTEDQVIVPAYMVDEEILTIRSIKNGTDITGANWMDLNTAARAWAKKDES